MVIESFPIVLNSASNLITIPQDATVKSGKLILGQNINGYGLSNLDTIKTTCEWSDKKIAEESHPSILKMQKGCGILFATPKFNLLLKQLNEINQWE